MCGLVTAVMMVIARVVMMVMVELCVRLVRSFQFQRFVLSCECANIQSCILTGLQSYMLVPGRDIDMLFAACVCQVVFFITMVF